MTITTEQFAPRLRLGVFQFAPRLRAVESNYARVAQAAIEADADLLVTPELSLTGYDLRDDVHTIGAPLRLDASVQSLWDFSPARVSQRMLLGAVERADSAIPYNAAMVVADGVVRYVHRKIYLPTYGMFDEGRYFGRGGTVVPFVVNGWRIGVLICEDFWHPMLAYLHALQGVHVLVVMAAAPGRGAWQGGEDGGFFASSDSWQRIARTYAQLYGIYVVICNRCGVEGGVTFAGESVVVAPDSSLVASAAVDEQLLQVELSAAAFARARTPYAHVRDEDAAFAVREIERIVGSQ